MPLESIIKDQIDASNKLSSALGIKACRVESATLEKIKNQGFNIIIGTPESWLKDEPKELLSSVYFRENLKCFVVDEVHLVSWGECDSPDEAPFREAFNRIGELRSFISENVPFLCLSATVNNNNVDLICSSCAISKNHLFL